MWIETSQKLWRNQFKKKTWENGIKKIKKNLTFQEDFVKLVIEEEDDVTWKSIINNIPKCVLSFALKAETNGVNTPDNLKRCGIRKTNKFELCKNWSNWEQILNWWMVAKDQLRTTWRHDSVLSLMVLEIKKTKPDNITIYADIPGHKFNNGTILPDIVQTSSQPDLIIINRTNKYTASV